MFFTHQYQFQSCLPSSTSDKPTGENMERKVSPQIQSSTLIEIEIKPIIRKSPLLPLKILLSVVRFLGGFPLSNDSEVKDFRFSRASYFGVVISSSLTICGFIALQTILLTFGSSILEAHSGLLSLGFNKTTIVVINLALIPNNFSLAFYVFILRRAGDRLANFCNSFYKLSWIFITEGTMVK